MSAATNESQNDMSNNALKTSTIRLITHHPLLVNLHTNNSP